MCYYKDDLIGRDKISVEFRKSIDKVGVKCLIRLFSIKTHL